MYRKNVQAFFVYNCSEGGDIMICNTVIDLSKLLCTKSMNGRNLCREKK